jgi:integrase
MPRRGDGITKRKDGRFQARITVQTPNGPKRKYIYGKKYNEVKRKRDLALGEAAKGIVYDDEKVTVGVYLDRWLNDSVRGSVRQSTFDRDSYLVRVHINPILGRIKLKKLTALDVQGFYRNRLDFGLSASTVNKIHSVLHKALSQAVKWNMIPRNVAEMANAPRPTPEEMRPLSAEETRRLLDAVHGDRLEALYVLAVTTGMRRGELLGLKWSDIDLENAMVSVQRTLTRTDNGKRVALGEPKTKKSRRTIRLTEAAVEALRGHLQRQLREIEVLGDRYADEGLVFTTEVGTLINPSNLRQRSLAPLLKKAGLPHIRFHDLRHTCATLLFQSNVHPKFVQELLGHATIAITLDTYSHVMPGMGDATARAMQEALSPIDEALTD